MLRLLVGSGDKIGLFAFPLLVVGLVLNVVYPSAFHVGGPSTALRVISIVALIAGVTIWVWSVVLILRKVPKGELITSGPFRLVKHPLYTGVALLVLPWLGFLLNTWLGAAIGIILYLGPGGLHPRRKPSCRRPSARRGMTTAGRSRSLGYRNEILPPSSVPFCPSRVLMRTTSSSAPLTIASPGVCGSYRLSRFDHAAVPHAGASEHPAKRADSEHHACDRFCV